MGIHRPSDDGYTDALRIRRGEGSLDPVFDGFVSSFANVFGVSPLTLITDTMPSRRASGVTPRLAVVLERTADARLFREPEGFNFDVEKQSETARLFAEHVPKTGLARRFGLPPRPRRMDWAEELFVHFDDFESTAKIAAHDDVDRHESDCFVAALELGDRFWCTRRFTGPPVVFVQTDEQAARLRQGGVPDQWADLYYALVRGHDEFGYIRRDEISIAVDSKETFDRDYASNWYYYFK